MNARSRSILFALWMAAIAADGLFAETINMEMVTVGNPGNAADTTGYGSIGYSYQIGKYEVTIQQYTDFLNAVAQADPYSLYNENMAMNLNIAGISRTGVSGSYTYSVISNGGYSGNRPITYVSWFDAARFANWMHNGQGTGSTETGAYTLVGGQISGIAPARNPGAQFYIPTENEWYKAAYYSPLLNSGLGGYYAYATQSNSAPGNIIGDGANQVNYAPGNVWSVTQLDYESDPNRLTTNYLTDVGIFSSSLSAYGTFDQSGNVSEWNDLNGVAGSFRAWRGGDWYGYDTGAHSVSSSDSSAIWPSAESELIGFRMVAPVPEPSTWVMGAGGLACAAWGAWRRRKRA